MTASLYRKIAGIALAALVALFAIGFAPSPAHAGMLAPASVTSGTTATTSMHRMYNPNSGEHFYTASTQERNWLMQLGWNYEGIGWEAPQTSKTPVYRLYNPNSGDHHYTLSANERNWLKSLGWNYEGIGWYSDDSKRVAVHRLFNPHAATNTHHYTTATSERDWLGTIGWNKEGVGWYAVKQGAQLPKGLSYVDFLRKELNMQTALYPEFDHGYKGADRQKYIMLHDTEIDGTPRNIVDFWVKQKRGIATHFIVGKNGSVMQCVGIDRVAWHAGGGDSASLKAALPDGVMNNWSIGIEMVHVGGEGSYPEAQLQALDKLIAYIDAYYGFKSPIIDHKMWRSSNSDTSPEFAKYLAKYRTIRRHA